MKSIISLLFVSLLASSLIIGCGSSDNDSGNGGATPPGSSGALSTDIASNGKNKPKVTPGCESSVAPPGCS